MGLCWGYSPKVEKYIPLGDYPADQYLIIAQQVVENLGWKLSHVSESGLIAYTGLSFQSYSEEISIRIKLNFAIFKSECVGVQMLFTDYGKNEENLQKFFDEFEYVQFQLKDIWEERLAQFHAHIATQDDQYFEKAPLAIKNKIKNVLYLFVPRKGYVVTPILLILNILYYFLMLGLLLSHYEQGRAAGLERYELKGVAKDVLMNLGANSRDQVLAGQVWRLISYQFIHLTFSHLFFNLYALIYIGLMVENKLGSLKTLAVYLLSGLCGGLISVVPYKFIFTIGASGAIMGLFGAFLALLISNAFEKNAKKALLISTILVAVYMLGNGLFSKNVDNAAHFGGILAGFVLTYLLYNHNFFKQSVQLYQRAALAFLLVFGLGFGVLWFSPRYQVKQYQELREQFMVNENLFKQVYNMTWGMPKEQKLQLIKNNAVDAWAKNLKIVAEMKKLTLMDKDKADLEYRAEMARQGQEIGLLMYKDHQTEERLLKYKIQKKLNEFLRLKSDQIPD
ncbi:rhomboid family intramembrane serine protease [Pedobacter gandavensis]|uniref:rhomboid family intramembrane serine protease n=1 Tax=Pedobacter gandavensis TaxID=2679963 RepID=UPI00292F4699|nr:rhomboid family intramembrane serine protease [Pedobacter gandavensis]